DLAHGLMELGLSGVLRSEPGHDAVRVVAHRSSPAFAPCSSAVHRTPGGAHMGSVARRTVRVGRRAGRPRGRCYRGSMPVWLLVPGAIVLGYVIWRVGMATLRSLAGPAPGTLDTEKPPAEAEDVEDLDVYLVCGECGTEFKVSRLGELQSPRHCGEKMLVVRRPRPV